MVAFFSDLRYGLRLLRRSPGFSLTVVLVLALGIGANSAVFSVVDAVLLRALPFRAPERLVMLWEKNPTLGQAIGERVPVAPSNFREWAKRATQFESIGGFEDANFNLTSGPEPERIEGARASANLFEVLGVKPQLGTDFAFVGNDSSVSRVVVMSNRFFQSHVGGQGNPLGQTLTLNDLVYTIIGVLPPAFHLPATREGTEQRKPDLFVPYDGSERGDAVEFNRRKMQVFWTAARRCFAKARARGNDRYRKEACRTGCHPKCGVRRQCLPRLP